MPWHGLFSQLLIANSILIYDDVQLPRGGGSSRGFMTRVQIKTSKGTEWLSIPVHRSGHGAQRICDVRVSEMDWRGLHLAKIEQAYRKAPFFEKVYEEVVKPIYRNETELLADFLIDSMKCISILLGITTPFERSSQGEWASHLSSTARVVEICRLAKAHKYLSGNGGMNYIDYEQFEKSGVKVHYLSYKLRPYNQFFGEFTPYVSIIDLLFQVRSDKVVEHLETKPVYWKDWPNKINGRPTTALYSSNN